MWFTLCFICCLLPPENLPKLGVRVVVDAAAAVSTGVCVCLYVFVMHRQCFCISVANKSNSKLPVCGF